MSQPIAMPVGKFTPVTPILTPSPDAKHDDVTALFHQNLSIKRANFKRRISTSVDFCSSKITDEDGKKHGEHAKEAIIQKYLEFDSDRIPEDEEQLSALQSPDGPNLNELLLATMRFQGRHVSQLTVEKSVKNLCTAYDMSTEQSKLGFFIFLAENYQVNKELVKSLCENLMTQDNEAMSLNIQEKLKSSLVPQYQWIFSQIGRLDNGVKFLVDFRTDLLTQIDKLSKAPSTDKIVYLKAMSNSLKDLLNMWFGIGFLTLERVTWQSPCEMLQKVSDYEAVHPIRNWTDLKRRVGAYRRCFVFTHGSMPGEPIVVLHTALTKDIAGNIKDIVIRHSFAARNFSLESDSLLQSNKSVEEDSSKIDTAIFYSITSTQKGLTGIELGNYLIKQVVQELQREFPKMSKFSSLSPIPGFKAWLTEELSKCSKDPKRDKILSSGEVENLRQYLQLDDQIDINEALGDLLKLNEWHQAGEEVKKLLEKPLMRSCAKYLYSVKRRGYAFNPVANFHLKNGAELWRLNWLADMSPKGLTQSCGIMVNYRYFLENCEQNSQNYLEKQTIEISDQVKYLVNLANSMK